MHLLEPTLAMVSELSRQQDELCVLLKKKDLEIREYKHLGVKISRSEQPPPPDFNKLLDLMAVGWPAALLK